VVAGARIQEPGMTSKTAIEELIEDPSWVAVKFGWPSDATH